MKSFASDNNSGVHPKVMQALIDANKEHVVAYGDDEYTGKAIRILKNYFGGQSDVFFVFNGTGANVIALQACVKSFHAVICAETAHINVDECGAPVRFTGCPLFPLSTVDGKLTPGLIRHKLHGFGDQHHSQPKVVYISQSTELGTLYTLDEIKAICDLAHEYDMYVHVDGARLANAAATMNVSLKNLTVDCGVDMLSFGGTKNGMMMGEAVVSFRKELTEYLHFYRKQSAQLFSKMRYLSAQFIAYFEDDLWLKNAGHANDMAKLLAGELHRIPGIRLTQKVETNALFLTMPLDLINKLRQHYFFYIWDEEINEIRLVTSFDTSEEDVRNFVNTVKSFI
jgi:threonine aldolase